MDSRIIVVDDDQDYLEILKRRLNAFGFKNVRAESDPVKAASMFEKEDVFDIAVIDMTMPGMNGIELLEIIKTTSPATECIMVTAVNEARVAVECIKKGAYDYLVKPVSEQDLLVSVRRALERKRLLDILDIEKSKHLPELVHKDAFEPIVTRSRNVLRILKEAELHAGSDVPVLITGESGTGKELLARAIHDSSPRSEFHFTPLNMASLTGSLFESEFFGHTKGAFTGAHDRRAGYLEHTNGGTLFLDEIGDMPLELQGKLMRVLQDGEYIRLGSNRSQRADIRFIAATNENLDRLMARKMFRKDLYYRIRGGRLHLPPLRERKDDIPLLINRFTEQYCGPDKYSAIEEEAMSLLMSYNYPGNIRELRSVIQSAANLAQGRPISVNFLPNHLRKQKSELSNHHHSASEPDAVISLAKVEKNYILKIYKQSGKNKSKTSRLLGIGLNTLRRKLKSYGAE
ncbi:sigma-54-dependent transcriptional regulator [Desulfonema magnum]|uniref:Two component system response regulator, sigma54-specific n=1 Tax=Desulfonema magnum TaxID=45655 RepID=A0A975BST4_9BACT|nr:sigma-54 dependent transcriptional regulator [Desulfonema magnum]QTA90965.1 Two component system response regulator, sigma54-specific [Desulfonema magnum]